MTASSGRYDYPDASAARIVPLTEEQLAERLEHEGRTVVRSRGRLWIKVGPGMYDAIHWLSRRSGAEARPPAAPCLGYRAALSDEEAAAANGAIPLHVLSNVHECRLESVPSREIRRDLRAFEKGEVRIVVVTDTAVFHDQGFEVLRSCRSRTGRGDDMPSHTKYLRSVERRVGDTAWLILAGLRGDTLLGYSAQWAVGRTAYLHTLVVSDEGLDARLSPALNFAAVQVYRRSGLIDEVSAGMHLPAKEGISSFKIRQGFDLVRVPSRVWLHPLVSSYLRLFRPHKHYRFTGREPRRVLEAEL